MNPSLWLMPSCTLFGHLLCCPAGQDWILGLCAPQAQHWVCCVPSKCRSQERVKSWVGAWQPWWVGEGLRLGQTELSHLGDLMPTREPDRVCSKFLCPVLWDFLEIPEDFLQEVMSMTSLGAPSPGAGCAGVPHRLQPSTAGTLPLAPALALLRALCRYPVVRVHSRCM